PNSTGTPITTATNGHEPLERHQPYVRSGKPTAGNRYVDTKSVEFRSVTKWPKGAVITRHPVPLADKRGPGARSSWPSIRGPRSRRHRLRRPRLRRVRTSPRRQGLDE